MARRLDLKRPEHESLLRDAAKSRQESRTQFKERALFPNVAKTPPFIKRLALVGEVGRDGGFPRKEEGRVLPNKKTIESENIAETKRKLPRGRKGKKELALENDSS